MSRAFWFTAFAAAGFTGAVLHYWADTPIDGWIIMAGFIWALFILAVIDIARTSGPR